MSGIVDFDIIIVEWGYWRRVIDELSNRKENGNRKLQHGEPGRVPSRRTPLYRRRMRHDRPFAYREILFIGFLRPVLRKPVFTFFILHCRQAEEER